MAARAGDAALVPPKTPQRPANPKCARKPPWMAELKDMSGVVLPLRTTVPPRIVLNFDGRLFWKLGGPYRVLTPPPLLVRIPNVLNSFHVASPPYPTGMQLVGTPGLGAVMQPEAPPFMMTSPVLQFVLAGQELVPPLPGGAPYCPP